MKMKCRNKRRKRVFLFSTLALVFVCVMAMGTVYGSWSGALTAVGNFASGSLQAVFDGWESGWEMCIADTDMNILQAVDGENVRVLTSQGSTEIFISLTEVLPREFLERQNWTLVIYGPLDFSDDSSLTNIECFSGEDRIRADVYATAGSRAISWENKLYETQSAPESLKFEALYGFEQRNSTFYASVQLIPTQEMRAGLLNIWKEGSVIAEKTPEGLSGMSIDVLDLRAALVSALNAAGVSDENGAAELVLTMEAAYSFNLTLPVQQKAYIPINP